MTGTGLLSGCFILTAVGAAFVGTVPIGAKTTGCVVVTVAPASFVVEVVVVIAERGLERIVPNEPIKPPVTVMMAVRIAGSA